MADQSESVVDVSADTPRFRKSYERRREEIAAVPDDEVVQVNVEIPAAVPTVLGAIPEIRTFRARLAEELPKFDLVKFDKLEDYTLALSHAHTIYQAASPSVAVLAPLAQQGARMRDTLLSDVQALVNRGWIDGAQLKEVKGQSGYRNIAYDLFTLSQVVRENWSKVQGKTALQLSELDEAEKLADRITTAVGERDNAPAASGEKSEMRERAFTLFIKTYNETRRAIGYLAPDRLEEVAPTVYIGRASVKKKAEPEAAEQPAVAQPASTHGAATSASVPATTNVPVGLPGSSPYSA